MVDASGLLRSDEAVLAAGGRVATTNEMADWLIGHLHSGLGNQSYDFPTVPDRVYTISKDMELPTLYGRDAVTVIVPPGVNVRYTDLGDSKLLFAEDFSKSDKWNGPLAIPPKVLEELSKRDYWAEAFIFAEPDEDANRKAAKTAAARNEQKSERAQQPKREKGGIMWSIFGGGKPAETAPAAAAPRPEVTAEDWIRAQGMAPATERAMIESLRRDAAAPAGARATATEVHNPSYPLVSDDDWKRHMATPIDKMTTDPWIEAQLKALGPATPSAAPPVLRPAEPASTGFVKGLLNKAFNLGAVRADGAKPAAGAAPASTGSKQKAPAV